MAKDYFMYYRYLMAVLPFVLFNCCASQDNACQQRTGRADFRQLENSCFWVSGPRDTKDWNGAQITCKSWEGNLATVARTETLTFLKMDQFFEDSKRYWIGLHIDVSELLSNENNETIREQNREADWKWLDETPYDYQNGIGWNEIEPWRQWNLGVLRDTEWTSGHSNHMYQFICETKLTTTPKGTTSVPGVPKPGLLGNLDPENRNCGTKEWTYDQNANKCYKVNTRDSLLSWTGARDECIALGGQLASASTKQQLDGVGRLLSKAGLTSMEVWIGLSHQTGATGPNENETRLGWQWLDGSQYNYMAWNNNEPEGGEKYVRMKRGMWWGINEHGSFAHYVCQEEPITMVPSQDPIEQDTPGTGQSEKSEQDGNGKGILGPVLGSVVSIVIAIVVIVAVVYFRRLDGKLCCVKTQSKCEKAEEYYCDVNDLEQTPKTSAHVYYNEEANPDRPVYLTVSNNG